MRAGRASAVSASANPGDAPWLRPNGTMDDFLRFALFALGWYVLQRLLLPRLGVPS